MKFLPRVACLFAALAILAAPALRAEEEVRVLFDERSSNHFPNIEKFPARKEVIVYGKMIAPDYYKKVIVKVKEGESSYTPSTAVFNAEKTVWEAKVGKFEPGVNLSFQVVFTPGDPAIEEYKKLFFEALLEFYSNPSEDKDNPIVDPCFTDASTTEDQYKKCTRDKLEKIFARKFPNLQAETDEGKILPLANVLVNRVFEITFNNAGLKAGETPNLSFLTEVKEFLKNKYYTDYNRSQLGVMMSASLNPELKKLSKQVPNKHLTFEQEKTIHGKINEMDAIKSDPNAAIELKSYNGTYDSLIDSYVSCQKGILDIFATNIQMVVESVHSSAEIATEEILKHAHFDLAVAAVPDNGQAGAFVTINIYLLGEANENPSPWPRDKTGVCPFIGDRLTLTLGFGISDIPGLEAEDIEIQDTYLVGVGWRLNRYFTLTAGAAITPDPFDSEYNCNSYYGVSLDVRQVTTAIALFANNLGVLASKPN